MNNLLGASAPNTGVDTPVGFAYTGFNDLSRFAFPPMPNVPASLQRPKRRNYSSLFAAPAAPIVQRSPSFLPDLAAAVMNRAAQPGAPIQ